MRHALTIGDKVLVETPFASINGVVKTVNVKMNCYTVQYGNDKAGGQFGREELYTPYDQIELIAELVRRNNLRK